MEMSSLAKELRTLKNDKKRTIYESSKGVQVTVTHTAKHSPDDYGVDLIIPGHEEFRPTHIRVLIDYYIKRESNQTEAIKLYTCLEKVYSGFDPILFKDQLLNIKFPMFLDEGEVNLYLSQLLFIEQDFNFGEGAPKRSKLNPPREYLMRFFRWVFSGDNQIDRIIFAAAGRKFPAPEKYSKPLSIYEA